MQFYIISMFKEPVWQCEEGQKVSTNDAANKVIEIYLSGKNYKAIAKDSNHS